MVLAPLVAVACDSARVAGGKVVASVAEPAGFVGGVWKPFDCRDASGEPARFGAGAVKVVLGPDGRLVLVESRPEYDSIVVTNSFVVGTERVFQLALKSAASAPYLREYRVPAVGPGHGRLAIVERQWDSRDTADGFVASYATKPAVTCALLQDRMGGT
jgi:hypothetical protein